MPRETDLLHTMRVIDLVMDYQQTSGEQKERIFNEVLTRFQPLIRTYYRRFYNLQYEREDFNQEMSLCLWAALRTFKPERQVTFGAYLSVRMYRRCLDLFRFTRHPRRYPEEGITSLYTQIGEGLSLADTLSSQRVSDPAQIFLVQEELRHFYGELSEYEYTVLTSFSRRRSFVDIATGLQKPKASVRSAYYRAHRKLREQLFRYEQES